MRKSYYTMVKERKKEQHRARRIAYWDSENSRMFRFITNNFNLTAEKIALIYKKRETMANRAIVQATEEKLPFEVFFRG